MKKFKNHQRPRRKYRFIIAGHKKALKIWWDSPFKLRCWSVGSQLTNKISILMAFAMVNEMKIVRYFLGTCKIFAIVLMMQRINH